MGKNLRDNIAKLIKSKPTNYKFSILANIVYI